MTHLKNGKLENRPRTTNKHEQDIRIWHNYISLRTLTQYFTLVDTHTNKLKQLRARRFYVLLLHTLSYLAVCYIK